MPGIGDVDELLEGQGVGVIVDEFSEASYERAAKQIRELAADPDARARCRAVARETFSLEEVGIPRYDRLYRRRGRSRSARTGGAGMRIGYAPYDASLSQPADRRRFPFYAARRGIDFELADPSRDYDVVVVTPRADLGTWSRYRPGRSKLVFDIVDSYLAIPRTNPKAILRGPAKFAAGEARHPFFSYRRALESMLRRADAVTCATPEQAAEIEPICPNVHSILDFQSRLVRRVKDDYRAGAPFHLVWEGLGENVRWFGEIERALAEVDRSRPLVLHLITAIEYRQLAQRFWRRQTSRIARRHFDRVRLYQWSEEMVSVIATACDLAVIPLPLDRPLERGKPESKLISFWRMGMPVVTSATPAYVRTMRGAGQDLHCASEAQWVEVLGRLIEDAGARERAGRGGRAFAERQYGDERLIGRLGPSPRQPVDRPYNGRGMERSPGAQPDLRSVLDALWRRRWLFLGILVSIPVVVYVVSTRLVDTYQARAIISTSTTTYSVPGVDGRRALLVRFGRAAGRFAEGPGCGGRGAGRVPRWQRQGRAAHDLRRG